MSGSAHAQSADEDERTGSDGSRRRMNKEGLATSAEIQKQNLQERVEEGGS